MGARGAYSEKCKTVDLADGSEVFEKEVPGEVLLGLNAAAYDSMCNVRQLECTGVDADAVKGAIENLLSSGDETTSVDVALKTLDKERVRLLHKNGKGGLVFDAERELDRIEDELHRAIALEADNVKYHDELKRTELQLIKLNKDYDISSKKCDLFEDVGRLEKFRRLNDLNKENEEYSATISELDRENGIVGEPPTYVELAEAKSAAESLKRAKETLSTAKAESAAASARLNGISPCDTGELEALLDEFSTPQSVINNLTAKKAKKVRETVTGILASVGALSLIGGAVWLATAMGIISGAVTVAFFGVICASLALVSFSRAGKTKRYISALIGRIGNSMTERDTKKIFELLDRFATESEERRAGLLASESASVKLGIAEDAHAYSLDVARQLLAKFSAKAEDGAEADVLATLADKLYLYLEKRNALLAIYKENDVLIKSLKSELERFDQAALEKKMTPEIEAAIKSSSYDMLKRERDAALYKINELNRYKAELERRLGAIEGGSKPPNDIFPVLEKQKKCIAALKMQYSAVSLAAEKLEEASGRLKGNVFPRIKESAQKNMALMTDGKYSELFLDNDMALSVLADGETRPIDALSKGSCDVAYFSVRLALLETTCEGNKPPLILDESLSQLDDGRAANTLSAIADYCENGGQTLLFTCQTRDALIAKKVASVDVLSLL